MDVESTLYARHYAFFLREHSVRGARFYDVLVAGRGDGRYRFVVPIYDLIVVAIGSRATRERRASCC